MITIAIYKNPSDFPGKYVARRFVGETPELQELAVADTLEEVRQAVPDGMVLITRSPDDDPCIYETWV